MKLKTYNSKKGVSKRKNGRFESYVYVRNAGGKSKKEFKAHVGTFDTESEAHKARVEFIKSLL